MRYSGGCSIVRTQRPNPEGSAVIRARRPAVTTLLLSLLTLAATAPVAGQSVAGINVVADLSAEILTVPERDSLVDLALAQVGTAYRWGAESPGKAFDCSGLVKWLLARFGVTVPRTSYLQAVVGERIPRKRSKLMPGDLLFFGHGKAVDHVGIYIGDGKFVHAANRRFGVIESELPDATSSWWKGVRRVFISEPQLPSDLAHLPISVSVSELLPAGV